MLGSVAGNRITVDVANETLERGPRGSRIQVVDYDGAHGCYYEHVNLDEPGILMHGGLEPSESDPRFHQQMVYAVAMRTLENFDRALGRRIEFPWFAERRLTLFPHAFWGANAFYDRKLAGILFGYFQADRADPGANLPGQNVFTCLSHDIIAHEMTHALVDRLRRHFMEPSNVDVLAFHEGFSDIVALLQHFSFQELLRAEIQDTRTDLTKPTLLVDMARQFGYATGSGRALRSAIDVPSAQLYDTVTEPHDRGAILVAAVFDGFFTTYQRRIKDLIRIATGGTGRLPDGDLHPDLVNRVSAEAAHTAQAVLTMCIQAFDYLPPVDVTFGDFLRALVTADYELVQEDPMRQRAAMIEGFRERGIYPERVASLAEESLRWEEASGLPDIKNGAMETFRELAFAADAVTGRSDLEPSAKPFVRKGRWYAEPHAAGVSSTLASALHRYAKDNAALLHLDSKLPIVVSGFHPAFRVSPNGRLQVELVAQFSQVQRENVDELGGIPFRGGTTVIASAYGGKVRYVISKPLEGGASNREKRAEAKGRRERQLGYMALCDRSDPRMSYGDEVYMRTRMARRMNLRALHAGIF